MIRCWFVGHSWRPLRFQPSPDQTQWVYQCRRCGRPDRR